MQKIPDRGTYKDMSKVIHPLPLAIGATQRRWHLELRVDVLRHPTAIGNQSRLLHHSSAYDDGQKCSCSVYVGRQPEAPARSYAGQDDATGAQTYHDLLIRRLASQ